MRARVCVCVRPSVDPLSLPRPDWLVDGSTNDHILTSPPPYALCTHSARRDLNDAEPVEEVAGAAREKYQELERGYQAAVGRLAAVRTQLQEQELALRTTIDTAIAAVRKGDIAMDMATRQGLVGDITDASRVLLELSEPDAAQFRQRLDDQFFRTSVGAVVPESDGAFEEVRVCVGGGVGSMFCVRVYAWIRGSQSAGTE